jgi:hypothetical protein
MGEGWKGIEAGIGGSENECFGTCKGQAHDVSSGAQKDCSISAGTLGEDTSRAKESCVNTE